MFSTQCLQGTDAKYPSLALYARTCASFALHFCAPLLRRVQAQKESPSLLTGDHARCFIALSALFLLTSSLCMQKHIPTRTASTSTNTAVRMFFFITCPHPGSSCSAKPRQSRPAECPPFIPHGQTCASFALLFCMPYSLALFLITCRLPSVFRLYHMTSGSNMNKHHGNAVFVQPARSQSPMLASGQRSRCIVLLQYRPTIPRPQT